MFLFLFVDLTFGFPSKQVNPAIRIAADQAVSPNYVVIIRVRGLHLLRSLLARQELTWEVVGFVAWPLVLVTKTEGVLSLLNQASALLLGYLLFIIPTRGQARIRKWLNRRHSWLTTPHLCPLGGDFFKLSFNLAPNQFSRNYVLSTRDVGSKSFLNLSSCLCQDDVDYHVFLIL